MEIYIAGGWWLRADTYAYVVARKVPNKKGEWGWVDQFYPATLSQAVTGLLERGLRTSDTKTLAELAERVDSLKEELDAWCRETDKRLQGYLRGGDGR